MGRGNVSNAGGRRNADGRDNVNNAGERRNASGRNNVSNAGGRVTAKFCVYFNHETIFQR